MGKLPAFGEVGQRTDYADQPSDILKAKTRNGQIVHQEYWQEETVEIDDLSQITAMAIRGVEMLKNGKAIEFNMSAKLDPKTKTVKRVTSTWRTS